MTTARRLLAGASWVYGAQILTVFGQFAYAAVTSRAVGADGFGAYAVALAVSGMVSLLATGGLGQTVSRMQVVDKDRVRPLVSYALLLGGGASFFLFLTAPLWASLWGVDAAASPIRWSAFSGFISPVLGLATGFMARTGMFRHLAIISVASNLAGMAVGVLAVMHWQTATSLIVSTAIAQALTLLGALLATKGTLLGLGRLNHARGEIGYSGRLASTSVLSYLTGNIVKFSMTRGIDAASLGQWNRAEVLTSIPMQQVQSALIRTIYPEFRHDLVDSGRARVVWTDMLILVSWLALFLSAVALVLAPPVIPLLFGEGWEKATALTGLLAVAGGLQILSTLLASAVEAMGRFQWIVVTEIILIFVQVLSGLAVFVFQDVLIAGVALIVTNVVRHTCHVCLLGRLGYLNIPRLLRNYLLAAFFSVLIGTILWWFRGAVMGNGSSPYFALAVAALLVALYLIFVVREKFPPVIIARKYGLLR